MDTPTQALLGAVIGQACFSHKLGRRAVWWGAVGGAIPDLDMLAVPFLGPWAEFVYHRGPTHALWFGPVVGPALGCAVWRWHGRRREEPQKRGRRAQGGGALQDALDPGRPGPLWAWTGLFVLALVTHPLLDLFTTYGTQLLAPFSHHRFALRAVPIVDPAYSLVLAAALVAWISTPVGKKVRAGRAVAVAALALSTAYLFYGLWLNGRAEELVGRQLAGEGIRPVRVRAYPTPLQVYLRRVVVRTEHQVLVGALTMWRPRPVRWTRIPVPQDPLVGKVEQSRAGRLFTWFASGEVLPRVHEWDGGFVVELDDLRYGFLDRPGQGIWGIRGIFDRRGYQVGRVARFYRPYPVRLQTLVDLFRAAFGRLPQLA